MRLARRGDDDRIELQPLLGRRLLRRRAQREG
jgi:hypothetical protein